MEALETLRWLWVTLYPSCTIFHQQVFPIVSELIAHKIDPNVRELIFIDGQVQTIIIHYSIVGY